MHSRLKQGRFFLAVSREGVRRRVNVLHEIHECDCTDGEHVEAVGRTRLEDEGGNPIQRLRKGLYSNLISGEVLVNFSPEAI